MKKSILLSFCFVSFLIISNGFTFLNDGEETGLSKDQRMEWWRQAKFGMFIHWGLYSVAGGFWNGKEIDGLGEWIMARGAIPAGEYEKLPQSFNPIKYNPAEYVRIAKEAGMKYIVITSKHHEGFAMYDSKVSDYDIVDKTPYAKDVLKPLSEECKKAGIKFCIYYSILDWHHSAQELNKNKKKDDNYGNNLIKEGRKSEYVNFMKQQLKEIITAYDPAIIWFDGGWMDWWKPEDGKDLMDYLWSLNPALIINNRCAGTEEMEQVMGDYLTPEQFVPKSKEHKDFETNMTLNDTWGYKKNDNNWKSPETLIHNLIDISSKGGNFLLNVGPTPEGIIPQPSVERLKEVGEWLQINGEAIYGTHNWVKWKEGVNELVTHYYRHNLKRDVQFTTKDVRFTAKENIVYAAFFVWPTTKIKIKSINQKEASDKKIKNVSLLGSNEKLTWGISSQGLSIAPPKIKPCKYAYVFKIEFKK